MKNLYKALASAAIALLAASCVNEMGNDTTDGMFRKYNLSFDGSTKTELSGSGSTRQVKWTDGDEIKYYTVDKQPNASTASVTLDGSSAFVEIPRGRNDDFINAVYGAGSLTASSSAYDCMYVASPAKSDQNYTTFAQAHLCAAFSSDLEDPNLRFHNAVAILKITSASAISKVVFSGNKGEVITGGSNGSLKITYSGGAISCAPASSGGTSVTVTTGGQESDFYIAILPVNFTEGIIVRGYDASGYLLCERKTSGELNTVNAAGLPIIANLGSLQDWLDNPKPTAVDLGLSVKWARTNLGATEPEEYGDYYAWGETTTKSAFIWSNYLFGKSKNGPFSKYVINANHGTVDHKIVLDLSDDAAHANWGGDWRMPTQDEVNELITNCQWTWTTLSGVSGYRVTSNKPGFTDQSIFLPANGMFSSSSPSNVGTEGNYWTASISSEASYHAISPYFDQSLINSGNCYRYFGLAIRPVEGAVVPIESLELPRTLELIEGRTATLKAVILPNNATYKGLTWSSSDESVATVDVTGKVTAVSIGKATVTAYSADASKTATCDVIVKETPYVDLGLSVKWAPWNVGATEPEEFGDYFAWGETAPKEYYSWATYKFELGTGFGYPFGYSKYETNSSYGTVDNKTALDPEDDAAHVNWGGSWRMPTYEEWRELMESCIWTRDTKNGVNGMLVTGPNGNSIFLPNTGKMYDTGFDSKGSNYWSSSLSYGAHSYSNTSSYLSLGTSPRYYGFTIRPVYGEVIPLDFFSIPNTLELFISGVKTLHATVLPETATFRKVNWISSDPLIITVDEDGTVVATGIGTATITAYSADGRLSSSCEVTVKEFKSPDIAEAIDLGLSVKWASFNLGACSPEDYGVRFAWGETAPKNYYGYFVGEYKFTSYSGSVGVEGIKFNKYCTDSSYWYSFEPMDNKTVLDPEDDAAHVNWGGSWRMPTDAEWTELWDNCTWTWTTQNGVNGMLVIGPNGNSIFLPVVGRGEGHYWTASLCTVYPVTAWYFSFYSGGVSNSPLNNDNRGSGLPVRPVFD